MGSIEGYSNHAMSLLIFFFLIEGKIEGGRGREGGRERERERERERIPSRLCSAEPDARPKPTNHKIMA